MSKRKDITGQKFNRLTAKKFIKIEKSHSLWLCKCECGNEIITRLNSLSTGNTNSCGCLQRDKVTRHGLSKHVLFKKWDSIKERCYNKNNVSYKHYGARGIKMHDDWESNPERFIVYILNNLGEAPSKKHTLDRIDNNKNYAPGNLRWANSSEQRINQRVRKDAVLVWYHGVQYPLYKLARNYNINQNIVKSRINLGWSIEKALEI